MATRICGAYAPSGPGFTEITFCRPLCATAPCKMLQLLPKNRRVGEQKQSPPKPEIAVLRSQDAPFELAGIQVESRNELRFRDR